MTEHSRAGLERARARWWATVSTGDLDGYLALFADDAVWVTSELEEIGGIDAIRAWLAPVFAQFDYEITITVADVRVAGNLGIERARFLSRMTPKDAPAGGDAPQAGRFLMYWRWHDDVGWLVQRYADVTGVV